jgi:predicted small metal-binding protein
MTKVVKCSDVIPGCNFEIRGNSEDEVLKKTDEHAKTAHNMHNMPQTFSRRFAARSMTKEAARRQRKQARRQRNVKWPPAVRDSKMEIPL